MRPGAWAKQNMDVSLNLGRTGSLSSSPSPSAAVPLSARARTPKHLHPMYGACPHLTKSHFEVRWYPYSRPRPQSHCSSSTTTQCPRSHSRRRVTRQGSVQPPVVDQVGGEMKGEYV